MNFSQNIQPTLLLLCVHVHLPEAGDAILAGSSGSASALAPLPVVLVDSSPPSNRSVEEPVRGGSVSLYSFWLMWIHLLLQTFRCKSSLVLFLWRRRYSSLTLILSEFHCPLLDSVCYLNGLCFHFLHMQTSLPSFCFFSALLFRQLILQVFGLDLPDSAGIFITISCLL